MNTLQLLTELQRYYDQKQALIGKKNTSEYNKRQYDHLMTFYNGKIKDFRSRVEKQDTEALAKFDADRANEIPIKDGIKLVS